ncbi:hypothetical protein MXB_5622 [Myxobolus squamalis]|nr:hypothetical protein MXB_5622 [Myxobolus squamalis]
MGSKNPYQPLSRKFSISTPYSCANTCPGSNPDFTLVSG